MDPLSLGVMALGAAGTAITAANKPGLPNIPPPLQPQQKPQPKPRSRGSMQDSFMTGVAGTTPTQPQTNAGKTMLGQ